MARTAEDLVRMEVFYCVSSLVSTLAQGSGGPSATIDLADLAEQAEELCSPTEDWEEAALQAGWTGPLTDQFGATYFEDLKDGQTWACRDWQSLCLEFDIEPYDREVFEHWIVSDWLADKLEAKGEKVDKDFAGLTVWARTTTGQGIASDYVIEQIVADLVAEYGA